MSSSGSSIPVTPSYIAAGRFANDNDGNNEGLIWIATLLCLTYSVLTIAIRGHLRWQVFALDDYLILIATVLQTGQVVAIITALQHGLGQVDIMSSSMQQSTANTATFAGAVLFLASICFSKLSVVFLMMRLFNLKGCRSTAHPQPRAIWLLCSAIVVIITAWGVGSILGITINCSAPSFTVAGPQTACPSQVLRWKVIGIIDAITEVTVVALSIVIVWPVQLKLSMKTPIVFAFAFRLPCAVLSVVHLHYIQAHEASDIGTTSLSLALPTTHTHNSASTIVPAIVLMQVELCWSLISATIPNLKSFVRSFNSGCGLGVEPEFMSKHGISSNSGSGSGYRSRCRSAGTGTFIPLNANDVANQLIPVSTRRQAERVVSTSAITEIPVATKTYPATQLSYSRTHLPQSQSQRQNRGKIHSWTPSQSGLIGVDCVDKKGSMATQDAGLYVVDVSTATATPTSVLTQRASLVPHSGCPSRPTSSPAELQCTHEFEGRHRRPPSSSSSSNHPIHPPTSPHSSPVSYHHYQQYRLRYHSYSRSVVNRECVIDNVQHDESDPKPDAGSDSSKITAVVDANNNDDYTTIGIGSHNQDRSLETDGENHTQHRYELEGSMVLQATTNTATAITNICTDTNTYPLVTATTGANIDIESDTDTDTDISIVTAPV